MGSPTPPRRQTDAAGRASRREAQLRKSGASGAAQLRRPGTRAREKGAEPAPQGSRALDSHGWRAQPKQGDSRQRPSQGQWTPGLSHIHD